MIFNNLYYIFCILLFLALAIFPQSPITKMGFKTGSSTDCNNANGEDMIQCWEKIAYSIDDIILSNRGFSDIKHFYAGYSVGLALSLKIETGMISQDYYY